MNISSGIAEISLGMNNSINGADTKVFLWPKISERPVEPVSKVGPKSESNVIYHRASDETRDKIIGELNAHERSTGTAPFAPSRPYYAPGTLFDARA